MFKKYITRFIFTLALVAMVVPNVVFGEGRVAPNILEILPESSIHEDKSLAAMVSTGDLEEQVLPAAIKMFLGMVATISFVMFIYAGVNLIISQGNEEEMTKFKNMLLWSVIGLAVITMSYAIVKGVMAINFEV